MANNVNNCIIWEISIKLMTNVFIYYECIININVI